MVDEGRKGLVVFSLEIISVRIQDEFDPPLNERTIIDGEKEESEVFNYQILQWLIQEDFDFQLEEIMISEKERNVLICLYNSLFSPFLQYGILVWGLTYETYINPVFLLQKQVIRAIAFENFTSHSTPIFSDLKILKMHDLFQLKLLTFVYESVHEISPCLFPQLYGTRQASKDDIFLTQKITNQYGLRSIHYHGSKCWNDIPVDIKRSPSVNIFRQRLKAFLFENNY